MKANWFINRTIYSAGNNVKRLATVGIELSRKQEMYELAWFFINDELIIFHVNPFKFHDKQFTVFALKGEILQPLKDSVTIRGLGLGLFFVSNRLCKRSFQMNFHL